MQLASWLIEICSLVKLNDCTIYFVISWKYQNCCWLFLNWCCSTRLDILFSDRKQTLHRKTKIWTNVQTMITCSHDDKLYHVVGGTLCGLGPMLDNKSKNKNIRTGRDDKWSGIKISTPDVWKHFVIGYRKLHIEADRTGMNFLGVNNCDDLLNYTPVWCNIDDKLFFKTYVKCCNNYFNILWRWKCIIDL